MKIAATGNSGLNTNHVTRNIFDKRNSSSLQAQKSPSQTQFIIKDSVEIPTIRSSNNTHMGLQIDNSLVNSFNYMNFKLDNSFKNPYKVNLDAGKSKKRDNLNKNIILRTHTANTQPNLLFSNNFNHLENHSEKI